MRLDPEFIGSILVDRSGLPEFKTYIRGEWVETASKKNVESPIDGRIIARVSILTGEEAVEAARTVYEVGRWKARNTPGARRLRILERTADILEENIDSFVEALVVNAGKTYKAARGEVEASIDRLRRAALDLRTLPGDYVPGDWDEHTLESEGIVRREPYGVVYAIIPFNYPLFDAVNKTVYSFLPGNAIILKPPSKDPIPVIMFVKALLDAGFPKDAIALITAPGRVAGKVAATSYVNVVSLTGSTETGLEVMRIGGIKQYIMELGGGDPAIVLSDADLGLAASKIATGITSYTGQRCDSIKLVLVEREVYDEFKDKLVGELSKTRIGDPRDPNTDIGPVIDVETVEDWVKAVEDAVNRGGRLLYGGRRLGKRYIEPALIEFTDHERMVEAILYKKEVFASAALITPVESVDEAVRLANGRRYGLDAAVFGKDVNKIRKLIRFLEVGAIYINEYPRHGIGYYPFGGRKDSGIGREGIGYSIEQVTALKTVVYNYKGYGIWEYM